MGLGKTLSALALCRVSEPPADWRSARTLIIVPKSLLRQWEAQIEVHLRDASTLVFYGAARKSITLRELSKAEFVLTTYETVRNAVPVEDPPPKTKLGAGIEEDDDEEALAEARKAEEASTPLLQVGM